MSINLTPAIEAAGFGISGDIGGLRRTIYYTPDGRVIKAIPQIRDFIIRNKEGKVTGNGTRDANLDKGWLLTMPQIKKLFCPTCDRWHDTSKEVGDCKIAQDKMIKRMTVKVKREDTDKTVALEQQVAELKAMVESFRRVSEGQEAKK